MGRSVKRKARALPTRPAFRVGLAAPTMLWIGGPRVNGSEDLLELRADPVFCYPPAVIDPVLLELLSAINYLFMSEDTTRLETVISRELR